MKKKGHVGQSLSRLLVSENLGEHKTIPQTPKSAECVEKIQCSPDILLGSEAFWFFVLVERVDTSFFPNIIRISFRCNLLLISVKLASEGEVPKKPKMT